MLHKTASHKPHTKTHLDLAPDGPLMLNDFGRNLLSASQGPPSLKPQLAVRLAADYWLQTFANLFTFRGSWRGCQICLTKSLRTPSVWICTKYKAAKHGPKRPKTSIRLPISAPHRSGFASNTKLQSMALKGPKRLYVYPLPASENEKKQANKSPKPKPTPRKKERVFS